jgi:hypothetical protein
VTRAQAASQLPTLFNRMHPAGVGEQGVAIASAFIAWLYQHQFEIVSFKERKAKDAKA